MQPQAPLLEELERRNRELSILNAIAQVLNRSVDLTEALQAALAEVAELLGLQTGWVWLLDESSGESYLAAALNLPAGLVRNPQLMEGSCYCLDTFRAGDLDGAANINVVTCSRLKKLVEIEPELPGGSEGLRYHASIPLYAHGKQLGVFNVASGDWRELSPADLRLLHTIGDMLSIAIERARLFAQSAEIGAVHERNRLAREIHDTLAQGLTGIALQLETADALLEGEQPGRARQAIQTALRLTQSNLEEARRSVLDLRAAQLEGRNLAEALAALADEIQSRSGLAVHTLVTGGSHPLPARLEAGLYRIAQEALANVEEHARAHRVELSLTVRPDQARLEVIDDGRGFETGEIPEGRFGLIGLNERARLLGGRMQIESSPGGGAHLTVRVPLGDPARGISE